MASGSWLLTTDGAWNNNANWSAAFPNALTDTATFATDITGATTVTMGQAISVGSMTFSDNGAAGSAWAIAPGGAFALTLGTSTITTTTDATISAAVSGSAAVTKAGNATLTLTGGGANTGAWAINAGTLAVTTANLTGTTGVITVASGATLTSSAAISKPITVSAGSTGNDFTVGGASAVTVNGTATVNGNTTGAVVVGSSATATLNGSTGALTVDGTGTTLGAGAFSVTGNLRVGSASANNATLTLPASRTVTIPSGASSGISVGGLAGSNSALYQTGAGSVLSSATVNDSGTSEFLVGGSAATPAYGYYRGAAGSFIQKNYFTVFCGVAEFDGVTFNSTDFVGNWRTTTLGRANDVAVTNYLSGSNTFGARNNGITVGYITAHAVGSQQIFNIDGSSGGSPRLTVVNAPGIAIYGKAAGITALLNISGGGYLTTTALSTDGLGNPRTNLMVGTLSLTGTCASPVYLFKSGNKLGSNGAATGVISGNLTAPTGYGVYDIPVTNNGSGYIGPPALRITTSGSGYGAAARAVWNPTTQQIDSVVVTCPGTGYAAGDTVTVSPVGGGGTGFATGTPVKYLNTDTAAPVGYSPDIEKIETGTLRLVGTNTNTGTYTITDGTLSIGNGGAAGTLGNGDASAVSIASAKTLNFNRSDSRTYTGVIAGAGNITKTTSGGTAILDADNTFTGTVTATTGALRAVRAASFGAEASSLTTASGGAIELAGGIVVARAVNLVGTGVSSTGALRNISGNNTISGTVAFTTGASIGSNQDTLTLSNTGTVSVTAGTLNFVGAGDVDFSPVLALTTGGVTKSAGAGAAILRGTNTYTGVNTITAGRLGYVGSIAPSVAGNFGNSALAANILIAANAGVRYYGSGAATFTRAYTFQGSTGTANYLESNGTGAVTHSVAPTYATPNATKTLGLGGTGTAANTISYTIANNGTGAVSVTKADAGKWVASQNNTATGAYAVNGGTLILQGTNTPASVAVSNANTVLGLEIATWALGAKRTGTATVTVNAGAKIQTFNGTGASAQNGRHTYTNLTFAANGRIRIGG